ncbi:MAG: hypothetical protein JW966_12690 [Anaerolineae bacterium]|nr:hypothetical protein [Anaerolineae bacterium]
MRRSLLLVTLVILGLFMAACNDNGDSSDGADSGGPLGLFDWNRDPDTIIVRLDMQPNRGSPAEVLNSIPPCTVWGDGRVVWTTQTEIGDEDVLEARATDVAIRAFLENIISRGFYDWEDELIPPSAETSGVQSITVFLYNELRTIRHVNTWPQNGYEAILDSCRTLSDQPVRVLPGAGWLSAYEVPRDIEAPSWIWPTSAPFTLQELAQNSEARWLEGRLATDVWLSIREGLAGMQVLERGGRAYQIAIAVPGVSRDAPPPPVSLEPEEAES